MSFTNEVGPFAHLGYYGADAMRPAAFTSAALHTGLMVYKLQMPLPVALDQFREQLAAADLPDPGEAGALFALLRAVAYAIRLREIEAGTDYFSSPFAVDVHAFAGFVACGEYEALYSQIVRGFRSVRHAPGAPDFFARLQALADQVKAGVVHVFNRAKLNYEGAANG